MKVACLQFDVTEGASEANLAVVERALALAAERSIELVVLPEMWTTSFPREVDDGLLAASEKAVERLRALSAERSLVVAGSAFGRTGDSAPSNRFQVFDSGERILCYDKIHLHTPTAEHASFTAGSEPARVVESSVGRLSGLVCYDLRFPEQARHAFRAGVDLLLVSAQWPAPRAAHWRALVVGRAVETQCFVVACNRTGVAEIGARRVALEFPGNSLVVSPHGEVLAEGRGDAGLVIADVEIDAARRMRVRVPVVKDERPDLYARWLDETRKRER